MKVENHSNYGVSRFGVIVVELNVELWIAHRLGELDRMSEQSQCRFKWWQFRRRLEWHRGWRNMDKFIKNNGGEIPDYLDYLKHQRVS